MVDAIGGRRKVVTHDAERVPFVIPRTLCIYIPRVDEARVATGSHSHTRLPRTAVTAPPAMSFQTIGEIDRVTDESSCDVIAKKINAGGRKNRFSYERYPGTVRARWNPEENRCRIFFDYDDETTVPVSFSGERGLAYFARQSGFRWLRGEPKWFREASRHAATENDVAEAMVALRKHKRLREEDEASDMGSDGPRETNRAENLLEMYGDRLRFIEDDPDTPEIREESFTTIRDYFGQNRSGDPKRATALPRGRKAYNPKRL